MDAERERGLTEMSEAKPELSVVMPVYNEGPNVARVLRDLSAAVRTPHEVLVVYDFDLDNTVPIVRALGPELPNVRLVRNELGRGVLNAMRAGFASARGQFVLVTMADGSDEYGHVDRMVALARAGAAVVAATRYSAGGKQLGGPRLKGFLSRAAGWLLHYVAGIGTRDPTSNFKLYSRRFLESTAIESRGGFELALELTVKAHRSGLRIDEVPTTWHDRTAGTSRFALWSWLPHYLRWFRYAMTTRFAGGRGGTPRERGGA
jgi:dolichol-phosphate mannosyltransferase